MSTKYVRRIGLVEHASPRKVGVSAVVELALSQAPALMDQVLDALLTAVAPKQAGKPGGLRPELEPVVRELAASRESVRAAFTGQLRVLAFGGTGAEASRPLVKFEDLQLLDARALDESIELARVQQDIEFAVAEVLPRFHALMSTVMGWISVQPGINPLRPELFAKAFRDTLAAHLVIPEVRSEILASSSGRFAVGLRQLYRELNEWLLSHGVEPAGLNEAALAVSATAAPQAQGTSETARAVLTLERLRRLFNTDLGELMAVSGRPGQDFLHTIPASLVTLQDMKQVDAMITRLEARRKAQGGAAAAQQQAEVLRKRPLDGRELAQQIGEEVTRMMVDNLTTDDRLLPRVRAVLRQLDDALVALARADMRFFSDARHPARQFLDRITDRSLAFTREDEPGFARFMASVEAAVEAILQAPPPRVEAFAHEIEVLQSGWKEDDQALIRQREETARALLHVEQRNLLAQRQVELWSAKLADRPIPALVHGFLLGPWAQVVAEAQLRCRADDSEVRQYKAVVEPLIWSVQPRLARRNPAHLVEIIPGMLATLRAGLQLIALPATQIQVFFDALIACHEEVLQEARAARDAQIAAGLASAGDALPALPPADERTAAAEEAARAEARAQAMAMPAEVPWLAASETSEAGYLDVDAVMPIDPTQPEATWEEREAAESASDAISEGAWVELMLDGQWTRLKLTWSSPHRTLFMFTSSRGRAHSMSRRSMARLMANGMIRIVSAGLVLDGALDAVAQQALRNSVSADKAFQPAGSER
ncbi:DUF1631 family protein [Tibeticola sp.]|uniref:DUF1631 family protein n=1 Tax=Tibeticola sp. TaxID=2005368 RepID=UPI0025D3CB9B|nr:DUF1631 family protein [Tibeticola sp.]